jgi:hypothetical protein
MTYKFPVARDIFERVGMTFVGAVLTAWYSDAANWQQTFQFDNVKTYVGAGLLALFTLAKSAVGTRIGKRDGQATSASLDPAVVLAPEGSVVR